LQERSTYSEKKGKKSKIWKRQSDETDLEFYNSDYDVEDGADDIFAATNFLHQVIFFKCTKIS
jgi:hypothetical protein